MLLHSPAFAVDTATVSVLAVAGLEESDTVDELLLLAVEAVEGDRQLGGAVQTPAPSSTARGGSSTSPAPTT